MSWVRKTVAPGLKRSMDKIYEIVVYALFQTLTEAMDLQVELTVNEKAYPLLKEFQDFSQKVMCLSVTDTHRKVRAQIHRVGKTNAADRGLDMYANYGIAIQVKHLSLDPALAEEIVESASGDRVVIVCRDAEKDVILSLLTQIGWHTRKCRRASNPESTTRCPIRIGNNRNRKER